MSIGEMIKIWCNERKWRKQNQHNDTHIKSVFPLDKISVGKGTYGPINVLWMSKNGAITIGNYCSIGPEVKFLVGGAHLYKRISTFPFQSKIYHEKTRVNHENIIIIEDDVWIGYEVLIMSGVTIGKGSVVGARSIVTKDIPPYSVFVGNKVIKQRFDSSIIEKIKGIDFSQINHSVGDEYQDFCQTEIGLENVDDIVSKFIKG